MLKLNVKHITQPIGGANNGNIRRLQIECEVCKQVYKSSGDLKAHFRSTKHGKFNCSFCKAAFITRGSLRQHTQVRHREDIINSILNASRQPEQQTDQPKTEQDETAKESNVKTNNAVNNINNDSIVNTPVNEKKLQELEKTPPTPTESLIKPKELNENTPIIIKNNKAESGVKTVTIKIADLRRKLNSITTTK